eukprot:7162936-Prymnesium_polylepis.1
MSLALLSAGARVWFSAKRAMVARISLAVSASTSAVDGMRIGSLYALTIATASLASMHVAHLVKHARA